MLRVLLVPFGLCTFGVLFAFVLLVFESRNFIDLALPTGTSPFLLRELLVVTSTDTVSFLRLALLAVVSFFATGFWVRNGMGIYMNCSINSSISMSVYNLIQCRIIITFKMSLGLASTFFAAPLVLLVCLGEAIFSTTFSELPAEGCKKHVECTGP